MSDHRHLSLVDGCYRCDLNRDEIKAAQYDMSVEARALRDMADDFRHIDMTEAAALCIEKAEDIEGDLR